MKMFKFRESTSFVALAALVLALNIVTVSTFPSATALSGDTEGDNQAILEGAEVGDFDNAPPIDGADSNCDCKDKEAMFHKYVRQLINANGLKETEQFLKQGFRQKKICGSDGQFYMNECHMQCKRIKDDSDLRRAKRIICKAGIKGQVSEQNSKRRQPKAGSKQKSGKLASLQKLEPAPRPLVCICPRNYFPICASNGITYGNRCAFECARENIDPELTVVTLGEKCGEDDKTVL